MRVTSGNLVSYPILLRTNTLTISALKLLIINYFNVKYLVKMFIPEKVHIHVVHDKIVTKKHGPNRTGL